MQIKRIDLKRFNALAAHTRSPAAAFISHELDWFSSEDESLIATLMLDSIDNDYVGVILGRDVGGRFRCIDLESSFPTQDDATAWIQRAIAWHGRDAQEVFPQGDTSKPLDLFEPMVS